MKYFLVVYDRSVGRLLELREYAESDRERALADRFAVERQRLGQSHIEVVVLGARSRRDLERTHSRYFKSFQEIVERLRTA